MRKLFSILLFAGVVCAQTQPVVRLPPLTPLLTAVAATGTQTGSAVRIATLGAYGTLTVTSASITGSPSACQIVLTAQQSTGTIASAATATQTITVDNAYHAYAITPTQGATADALIAVYSCSVYPGAGTLTVGFSPYDVETVVGALPAGTNVIGHVIADTGSTTAVTALPAIPTGSNVIGHVIADTGSTTAVTALPALPSGTNVIGHVIPDSLPTLPAGTNVIGHVIADTGSTTAVTALPAIPTGANVIGHVIADTGSTTAVTALPALPSGTNVIGHVIPDSLPTLPAGTNVIGHVIADTGSTTAVTALPAIPTGANVIGHVIADTGSTTAVTALPALPSGTNVIGHVIPDSLPTLPAGTNVIGHVIADTGSTTAVTALPALPAGSAVIGHVIADTGSTTAVTALPAIPSGSNVIGHIIADTGSTTAVTALPAIPTGSNVIGHIIADTGSTTAVTALPALPSGSNVIGHVIADSGTVNAAQNAANVPSVTAMQTAAVANANGTSLVTTGYTTCMLQVVSSPSMSGGTTVNFEASADAGTTWVSILAHQLGVAGVLASSTTSDGTFRINCAGLSAVRARISAYSAGTVTVSGYESPMAGNPTTVSIASLPSVAQATAANLNAQVVGPEAVGATPSANPNQVGALGSTALPTIQAAGKVVRVLADRYGRIYTVAPVTLNASSAGTPITTNTNTTIITAPSAGSHLRIHRLWAQNAGATGTWCYWGNGSGVKTIPFYVAQYQPFSMDEEGRWELSTATGLFLNTATTGASIEWFVEYEVLVD